MKKILLLIILFSGCFLKTNAQKPGDLDSSFGNAGIVIKPGVVYEEGRTLAIQPDGKILVGGNSEGSPGFDFLLLRYLQNGTIDTSFGIQGSVITSIGAKDYMRDVKIQPDGKILAAGTSDNRFALVRYNTDGSIDKNFGFNGQVTTVASFQYSYDECRAVEIDSQNRILLAGTAGNGVNDNLFITRYLPDGGLDYSFADHGISITDFGSSSFESIHCMKLQKDGKIVVGGRINKGTGNSFLLVRYNTDGIIDSTFGSGNGVTITSFGTEFDEAFSLGIQKDGKIVLVGISGDNASFALARFTSNGILDPAFGQGGKVTTEIGDRDDYSLSVSIQNDNKIIAAGYTSNIDYSNNVVMVRYNMDGTLDSSFGNNGKVLTISSPGKDATAAAVLTKSDGKILITGSYYDSTHVHVLLLRYLSGFNVGIADFSLKDNSGFIFPNPVRQSFTLEYEILKEENISVELMDINGRLIRHYLTNVSRGIGKHREMIELDEALAAGTYILSISNNTGLIPIKLIKEN